MTPIMSPHMKMSSFHVLFHSLQAPVVINLFQEDEVTLGDGLCEAVLLAILFFVFWLPLLLLLPSSPPPPPPPAPPATPPLQPSLTASSSSSSFSAHVCNSRLLWVKTPQVDTQLSFMAHKTPLTVARQVQEFLLLSGELEDG